MKTSHYIWLILAIVLPPVGCILQSGPDLAWRSQTPPPTEPAVATAGDDLVADRTPAASTEPDVAPQDQTPAPQDAPDTLLVDGEAFPTSIEVEGVPLRISGAGTLVYNYLFDVFCAVLYLPEEVQPVAALEDHPKRLELSYFYAIDRGEFAKTAQPVLEQTLSEEELQALEPRLQRINRLYRDVEPGDRYALTYTPGLGTELSLNDRRLGVIPGADFARAYFSIWLGRFAGDADLRRQLLTPVPPR